ncbi:MAG: hypothetical protein L6R37_003903 [Teloschistes peruensis]|nr:MAG: hypothetical protein L6R37_003903 [Teloschistes peruensis]
MAEGPATDISSGTPSIPSSTTQDTATPTSSSSTTRSTGLVKPDTSRKRRRSEEDTSQTSAKPHTLATTPKPFSPKFSVSPPTLTAAQALIDQRKQKQGQDSVSNRQTSPNPAATALSALQGLQMITEKGFENALRAANAASETVATADVPSQKPEGTQVGVAQMQPNFTPSSGHGPTAEAMPTANMIDGNGTSVASPGRMKENMGNGEERPAHATAQRLRRQETDPGEGRSDKALTYPGPLPNYQQADRRRNTHSGFGRDSESKSPSSAKKHQCPYCSTTFTRHHNLKSHLLTHSHEKPYYCDTCDSRFRRLHDLKRHSKLHTGERPHTCPKCHRSFARGDALARHSKGAGGCAGRRSSLGNDDPEHEEAMSGTIPSDPFSASLAFFSDWRLGLLYTGEASHEPERMEDDTEVEGSRKGSLPSIKRHDAPTYSTSDDHSLYATRQPSTYPPIMGRQPNPGGLYPPIASPGAGSSSSNSPRQASFSQQSGSSSFQAPSQNVFAQGGMTESPKPLSPGSHQLGHPDQSIHRNRSPSLTQQFQQQQFGRRGSTQTTSPAVGLPPIPTSGHSGAPHLPTLPGLPAPPDLRFTLHSQAGAPPPVYTNPPGSGPSAPSPGFQSQSGSNSLSSQSGDGNQNPYNQNSNDRLWAYIRSLEVKIDRLQEEVGTLRGQLASSR